MEWIMEFLMYSSHRHAQAPSVPFHYSGISTPVIRDRK